MSRRFRPSSALYGASFTLLLVLATGAAAQESEPESGASEAPITEQAREHFRRGVGYYAEGDLAAAMVEFERAYELQPTYRLLYNLGQVAYEQRDYAAAERFFRNYLKQGGAEIEDSRRDEVETELARLKGRVADVLLVSNRADAELFVDDRPVGRSPLAAPVRISAGRRSIRAELPGHAPVLQKVDVVGGESMRVELLFGGEIDAPRAAASSSDSSSSAALWTGVATAALGLGTAGMALWANSDERSYEKALGRMTTRSELDELANRTEEKALVTDILLGATIVTGTITLILLLTDDSESEERPASVQLGPGSVRASF